LENAGLVTGRATCDDNQKRDGADNEGDEDIRAITIWVRLRVVSPHGNSSPVNRRQRGGYHSTPAQCCTSLPRNAD